ncbi:hypothetical protein NKJ46_11100 [Mesorhizobium sp. M0166]|uniref:hypothetical protein n=1 Tax=Mesorhizobium sp. M0166 TaxID=2956902 RepID=UPI003338EB8B
MRVLLELSINTDRDCAETRDIAQVSPNCACSNVGWIASSPAATSPAPAGLARTA